MEHVKWVTASTRLGWVGLTEGKDYKVLGIKKVYVSTSKESVAYTVVGDNGTKLHAHSSFFYDPKSLPQQPTPCEEVGCDSFDGLVYVAPTFEDTRVYRKLEKTSCSQEQWQFLLSNLPTKVRGLKGDTEHLTVSSLNDLGWFDATPYTVAVGLKVSFNDLFKHKGDV